MPAKREQVFRAEKGDYFVRVIENGDGTIHASDFFSERSHLGPTEFRSWELAVKEAERCVKCNEGFYAEELPVTPLCPGDICHWGFSELYANAEAKLRELLASGKDFDTGFGGSKKEIMSARFYARGDTIKVTVVQEMDDLPDLVYDAVPDGIDAEEELLDEIADSLEPPFYSISTSAKESKELPRSSSYEDVLNAAVELTEKTASQLEADFKTVKRVVRERLILEGLLDANSAEGGSDSEE